MTERTTTDRAAAREAVIERTFDAPRELVWALWTDPAHARHWYGPAGATVPACEMDVRPGGRYRIHMRTPDGDCIETGTYVAVAPCERLEMRADVAFGGTTIKDLRGIVTFEDLGGSTRVVVRQSYNDEDFTRGAETGWTQCLERLDAHLSSATAPERTVVVERVLEAPRERVWSAWTDAEALARWFRPEDCDLVEWSADVRVGGRYRQALRCGGEHHAMHGHFRVLDEPARIVFTHQWETPDAPRTIVTVELDALDARRTALRLTQTGLASADSARSHAGGWSSCLDRLAREVAPDSP